MSDPTHDGGARRPEDEIEQEQAGAEIGMSEDGSTFEPEEDPEGHTD